MSPAERTRLDSWKAIAQHLGRTVRAVARWADDRVLPVHRIPGGKRQAIFAYKDEIDAWLDGPDGNRASTPGNAERERIGADGQEVLGSESAQGWRNPNYIIGSVRAHKWSALAVSVSAVGLIWVFNVLIVNP